MVYRMMIVTMATTLLMNLKIQKENGQMMMVTMEHTGGMTPPTPTSLTWKVNWITVFGMKMEPSKVTEKVKAKEKVDSQGSGHEEIIGKVRAKDGSVDEKVEKVAKRDIDPSVDQEKVSIRIPGTL